MPLWRSEFRYKAGGDIAVSHGERPENGKPYLLYELEDLACIRGVYPLDKGQMLKVNNCHIRAEIVETPGKPTYHATFEFSMVNGDRVFPRIGLYHAHLQDGELAVYPDRASPWPFNPDVLVRAKQIMKKVSGIEGILIEFNRQCHPDSPYPNTPTKLGIKRSLDSTSDREAPKLNFSQEIELIKSGASVKKERKSKKQKNQSNKENINIEARPTNTSSVPPSVAPPLRMEPPPGMAPPPGIKKR